MTLVLRTHCSYLPICGAYTLHPFYLANFVVCEDKMGGGIPFGVFHLDKMGGGQHPHSEVRNLKMDSREAATAPCLRGHPPPAAYPLPPAYLDNFGLNLDKTGGGVPSWFLF